VANVAGLSTGIGLGGSTNVVSLGGGILELRSDVNVTYSNVFNLLATGSTSINIGELAGGNRSQWRDRGDLYLGNAENRPSLALGKTTETSKASAVSAASPRQLRWLPAATSLTFNVVDLTANGNPAAR